MSHSENTVPHQSLVELSQFSDFEITGEEAGFILHLHELRHKKIREFTPSDFRVCLAQDVGRPLLLPIALEVLETDPWIEAEFYPGDLLLTCASIPIEFWDGRDSEACRFGAILGRAIAEVEVRDLRLGRKQRDELHAAKQSFPQSTEPVGDGSPDPVSP